jgi:hypothetical protein
MILVIIVSVAHTVTWARPDLTTGGMCLRFLQLHSIVRFCPEAVSLQPAYFIAVDHQKKAIVWGEAPAK